MKAEGFDPGNREVSGTWRIMRAASFSNFIPPQVGRYEEAEKGILFAGDELNHPSARTFM